jgi:hypothetical protein
MIQTIIAGSGILASFLGFVVFHSITGDLYTRFYDIEQALLGIAFICAFVFFSFMKKSK